MGIHIAVFAARAGLTEAQIAAIATGQSTDRCWSDPFGYKWGVSIPSLRSTVAGAVQPGGVRDRPSRGAACSGTRYVRNARGQEAGYDRHSAPTRTKKAETFRAYVADPERPGRKVTGPWGTYEQAVDWRGKALGIKAEAKRVARERRAQAA